jgi:phosphoribosylanthranilate isomerase
LHGDESPRFCKELGLPVIKTFDVFNDGSIEKLKKYDTFAFLLDLPKGGGGRTRIDPQWACLAKRHGRVLLAGNLTAAGVGDLVRKVRPYGVDVCGATEKAPGVKDRARIREFIQAAIEAHKETTRIKVRTR